MTTVSFPSETSIFEKPHDMGILEILVIPNLESPVSLTNVTQQVRDTSDGAHTVTVFRQFFGDCQIYSLGFWSLVTNKALNRVQ